MLELACPPDPQHLPRPSPQGPQTRAAPSTRQAPEGPPPRAIRARPASLPPPDPPDPPNPPRPPAAQPSPAPPARTVGYTNGSTMEPSLAMPRARRHPQLIVYGGARPPPQLHRDKQAFVRSAHHRRPYLSSRREHSRKTMHRARLQSPAAPRPARPGDRPSAAISTVPHHVKPRHQAKQLVGPHEALEERPAQPHLAPMLFKRAELGDALFFL